MLPSDVMRRRPGRFLRSVFECAAGRAGGGNFVAPYALSYSVTDPILRDTRREFTPVKTYLRLPATLQSWDLASEPPSRLRATRQALCCPRHVGEPPSDARRVRGMERLPRTHLGGRDSHVKYPRSSPLHRGQGCAQLVVSCPLFLRKFPPSDIYGQGRAGAHNLLGAVVSPLNVKYRTAWARGSGLSPVCPTTAHRSRDT